MGMRTKKEGERNRYQSCIYFRIVGARILSRVVKGDCAQIEI